MRYKFRLKFFKAAGYGGLKILNGRDCTNEAIEIPNSILFRVHIYDNNEVIAWKKGLTDKPITLNLKADANTPTHEFVMVADNLGSIPPNTALMVVTTGGKRYQVFVSSDKQKNAKVIVQYDATAHE